MTLVLLARIIVLTVLERCNHKEDTFDCVGLIMIRRILAIVGDKYANKEDTINCIGLICQDGEYYWSNM